MDIKEARSQFSGLADKTFLDAACCSIVPNNSIKALEEFIENCALCPEVSSSAHHIAMDARRNEAVSEAAKLLNADIEEIALVESTTYGLNVAATSLKLPPGSKVLTADLEFLQVAIPWCMQKDGGIIVEVVKSDNGRIETSDFEKAIDESTKMIVISSVQWCNGWKADLEEFGEMCKTHNIYLVIDAVHHLGINELDVKKCHIDILTAGGHKWLNAPFGCGILYINKELLNKIDSVFWGYLTLEDPEGGWATYFGTPSNTPVKDWRFTKTAKRFEVGGTSNYLGAIALAESLKLVNEIGIKNIEEYSFRLSEYLMNGLERVGAKLITHRDTKHRSGMVVFRFYNTLEEENELLSKLHKKRIYVAMRFTSNIGGIRVSCQYFNNKEDIDILLSELENAAKIKAPDYKV